MGSQLVSNRTLGDSSSKFEMLMETALFTSEVEETFYKCNSI